MKEKDLLEIEGKETLKLYLPVLDQTVDAKIVYISPSNSGGQQGGFVVKAQIANPENVFRPGMSAQLILDDSMAQKSAAVPIASVLRDGDKHYVFTLSNDRAVRTQVEVGRKNKDLIEITAGLKEGDSIVVVGQSLLSDGDIVEIVD
ncbi:copper/silver efflux system membrane fusion protein CusB [compost metagenome]